MHLSWLDLRPTKRRRATKERQPPARCDEWEIVGIVTNQSATDPSRTLWAPKHRGDWQRMAVSPGHDEFHIGGSIRANGFEVKLFL